MYCSRTVTDERGASVEPLIVFVPGYHAKQPRRRNTTAARHAGEAAVDSHRQVHRIAAEGFRRSRSLARPNLLEALLRAVRT